MEADCSREKRYKSELPDHAEGREEFSNDDSFPWFIELCAGSAILSSHAKNRGFRVLAVDHVHNRHETKTAVECLDLTLGASWQFLRDFKNKNKVLAWHFGLPCGTCSRAREIQMSADSWGPPPLRSEKFLLGNPWNSQKDQDKVAAANVLYEKACDFILELIQEGHIVTIENPTGSWLWMLPYLQPILGHCYFVDLHTFSVRCGKRRLLSQSTTDAFNC